MRRAVPVLCTAVLLGVCASAGPASGADVSPKPAPVGRPYAVRDLTLPAETGDALSVAVNAEGVIAGWVRIGGNRHAVVWDASGRVRDLGVPENGHSWAVDVADNGWVTGTSREWDGTEWPWVWTGSGAVRRLDGLPTRSAQAVAISRSGRVLVEVAGGAADDGGERGRSAWIWTPGAGPKELPGLGGENTRPFAFNDAGQAVGASAEVGTGATRLVFWDTSGAQVTGPIDTGVSNPWQADIDEEGLVAATLYGPSPQGEEGVWTVAWDRVNGVHQGSFAQKAVVGVGRVAINERRQVAFTPRYSDGADDCSVERATLWTVGRTPGLVRVGGCTSEAQDVNDAGEVAGMDGVAEAWVWDGRLVHVLPVVEWQTSYPYPPVTAMNDAGLVVGGTTSGNAPTRARAWVPPGGSVTVQVEPAADTYMHPALPRTSFARDVTLAGGGRDSYLGLMRFAVPRAPAGRRLVAARLHLHTGSQAFAGSRDAHRLFVTGGDWSEATTWATRPRLGPALSRSWIGATGADMPVAAYLDTRQVHAGRDLNLAITGGGADSLWWSSREAAPHLRPRLELIYR